MVALVPAQVAKLFLCDLCVLHSVPSVLRFFPSFLEPTLGKIIGVGRLL
jgi:hypothetical protein